MQWSNVIFVFKILSIRVSFASINRIFSTHNSLQRANKLKGAHVYGRGRGKRILVRILVKTNLTLNASTSGHRFKYNCRSFRIDVDSRIREIRIRWSHLTPCDSIRMRDPFPSSRHALERRPSLSFRASLGSASLACLRWRQVSVSLRRSRFLRANSREC